MARLVMDYRFRKRAYETYANSIKKRIEKLSHQEKQQAIVNAIIKKAEDG